MSQPVLTRCPSCGAQIQADASHAQVTCLACGTTSSMPGPASGPGPASPSAGGGGLPRRVVILIVLGALLPVVISAVVLVKSFAARDDERTFPIVHDYLGAPETVAERVEQITGEVRRIEISRGGLEVYDASGQRYSIAANGTHVRRGGAVPVPAQSFAVADVDFAGLPRVLEAASARTGGAQAYTATIEITDGEPMWRVTIWAETGATELTYSQDAQLRLGSNAQ